MATSTAISNKQLSRIQPPTPPNDTDDYTIYEFTPGVLIHVKVSSQPKSVRERVMFSISAFNDRQLVMTLEEFQFVFSDHGFRGGRYGNVQTKKNHNTGPLHVTYVDASFLPMSYAPIAIILPVFSYDVIARHVKPMFKTLDASLPYVQRISPKIDRPAIRNKNLLKRILFACTREHYERSYRYFSQNLVSSDDKNINLALGYLKEIAFYAANWCLKCRGYAESPFRFEDIITDDDITYETITQITTGKFFDPVAYWFVRGDTVSWRKLC